MRLDYRVPARGLIGFSTEFLNITRGTGLMSHIFDGYEAYKGEIGGRKNGVLISQEDGEIVTYALGKLDDRGRMFVKANDPVYEGMIVGIHSRDNDLVVNAVRMKQLTNFRVSGKEDAIKITPPGPEGAPTRHSFVLDVASRFELRAAQKFGSHAGEPGHRDGVL